MFIVHHQHTVASFVTGCRWSPQALASHQARRGVVHPHSGRLLALWGPDALLPTPEPSPRRKHFPGHVFLLPGGLPVHNDFLNHKTLLLEGCRASTAATSACNTSPHCDNLAKDFREGLRTRNASAARCKCSSLAIRWEAYGKLPPLDRRITVKPRPRNQGTNGGGRGRTKDIAPMRALRP